MSRPWGKSKGRDGGKDSRHKGKHDRGARRKEGGELPPHVFDMKGESRDMAWEEGSEQNEGEDDIDGEGEQDDGLVHREQLSVNLCMWEFGQNDPKRDSGSKLHRLGYAKLLRIGQSFPGIVLSSEATTYASPADAELVSNFGISGINCSWNRLEEIPFGSLGKGRNQRILPLLFAANSVNYGRPFKMNTAEAMAACLYITGFKDDARIMLSSFGYGPEFLRLNHDALEAYSNCRTSEEVRLIHQGFLDAAAEKKKLKEEKKERDRTQDNGAYGGSYLNEDDYPPIPTEEEEDYEEEEEEGEGGEGEVGGGDL